MRRHGPGPSSRLLRGAAEPVPLAPVAPMPRDGGRSGVPYVFGDDGDVRGFCPRSDEAEGRRRLPAAQSLPPYFFFR